MARCKGMGNLQREKSGRWTIRIGYMGRRISRSTGTTDRARAERMLARLLAPMGLGEKRLPLADVWCAYLRSPNRRDLAQTTLESKRNVWMHFARWMEANHIECGTLAEVPSEAIAEYLAELKFGHTASTYNNRVCVLREIFHVLADKAGCVDDPWEGVRLLCDDCHSRRELTIDEIRRLLSAAETINPPSSTSTSDLDLSHPSSPIPHPWKLLFLIGLYTGLRLGDCCKLKWSEVQLDRGVIQLIPSKTKKHAHGKPVTIPIHPVLREALIAAKELERSRSEVDGGGSYPFYGENHALPEIAEMYLNARWRVSDRIARIFKQAGIRMRVKVEGRERLATEASFHSLRHTFVSLAANAGVPLAVVQSIVGHTSTVIASEAEAP